MCERDRERKTHRNRRRKTWRTCTLLYWPASCHTQSFHLGLLLFDEKYSTGGRYRSLPYRAPAGHSPWLTVSGPETDCFSVSKCVYNFPTSMYLRSVVHISQWFYICCFGLFIRVRVTYWPLTRPSCQMGNAPA